MIFSILISAFCLKIQSAAIYLLQYQENMTVDSLHLGVQLVNCTPFQYLHCNISYDRCIPDTLRSTEQLRLSILPKGIKNMMTLVRLRLKVDWSRVWHCSTRPYTLSSPHSLSTFNPFFFFHSIFLFVCSGRFNKYSKCIRLKIYFAINFSGGEFCLCCVKLSWILTVGVCKNHGFLQKPM